MTRKTNRREFIFSSLAIAGNMLVSPGMTKNLMTTNSIVPRREFGNTGVKISKLCFGGGSFAGTNSETLLDEALKYGVNCWEIVSFTGKVYADYFKKHPEIREKVFLTGKVYSADPTVMEKHLGKLLNENETSTIDFLAVHVLDNIEALTDDVRKWVEKVKKEKKIRFFGFCTHRNMDNCLNGGAELGWIDGIQTFYNYRMQSISSMEDALQKCNEKGIGIFAVKSMGLGVQQKTELQKLSLNEEKLNSILVEDKMSFEQAKLKTIWQNSNLTSICSFMPNPAILQSNITAAMDECPLKAEIKKLLADYAHSTGKYFCRRCGICEKANEDKIPISGIMEMLMYARGYAGFSDWGVKSFAKIPVEIKNKINNSDYSIAEKKCPQKMPIEQLMKEAYAEFQKE